ncbi:hypothetical protein EYZ11_002955 [Aspergillus tanneri]|uniref:Uncharacterized protein n=1 Tax=Aspergillus tanneri TaxID=1220188 RepID=A0A4S3JQ82_9EURO|nr:hypothetical protein EYZ11_002955 [Aspergillus tanneri]
MVAPLTVITGSMTRMASTLNLAAISTSDDRGKTQALAFNITRP